MAIFDLYQFKSFIMNHLLANKSMYVLLLMVMVLTSSGQKEAWIELFDGKSLQGWKASENQASWEIENGSLVGQGERSHLFYDGDFQQHNFVNFELKADVKTTPFSNSGIYFHTEFQEKGWPKKGYECQVINAVFKNNKGWNTENKMTGSLYGIRNLAKSPVNDDEWFNYRIVVQGKTIKTYINGELMVDYTEPENPLRRSDMEGRLISSGTFALQCHDPKSKVYYKNIR